MSMKQNPEWKHHTETPVVPPSLPFPAPGALLDLLPAAIYTIDTEGYILYYNAAAEALWGGKPQVGSDRWTGPLQKPYFDANAMASDPALLAQCLQENRPVDGEMTLAGRDGRQRTLRARVQPLHDESGKLTGALVMLEELEKHRANDQPLVQDGENCGEPGQHEANPRTSRQGHVNSQKDELLESGERYHKMIEEVEDYAIILLDRNGIIQNWNRGAEKIKGYKEGEIVGRSFSTFYLPEDRASGFPQKLLEQARKKGKAIHEGWRMRKDGSRFWGSIVLTALHNNAGDVIGFSKVTRDLTERKLAEDRLREYTNQLEFQNKELEQFAYAASHDMKEPLRKIHLYNTFIAENEQNRLDEKSREFLKRSIDAVRRMANLIDDLLAYSKMAVHSEGFRSVQLDEVLDEIVLIYKEELEQHKVQIDSDPLPVVKAIPFQMHQLFYNLINNSIKYRHPARSPVIQVRSEMVLGIDFDPDAEPNHHYYRLSVIDNGIGFDPLHVEKIFNIFQRLSHNRAAGSGIGLAICKRIVQNHHGFIKASAQPGEGARFDVYLPA